jgi:hypothetical protein
MITTSNVTYAHVSMPVPTVYTRYVHATKCNNPIAVIANIIPCCHLLSRYHAVLIPPWRWRRYVPPKLLLTFNGLHGVISQKKVLFITTALRTSNPAILYLNCQLILFPHSFVNKMGNNSKF